MPAGAAPGGDVAGVDTGLRAARAEDARRGTGETLSGQWADAGPVAGAVARSRRRVFTDAAGNTVAPSDSNSGQRVGGRQGWLDGGGYGGAVWGQRRGGVCVDGGRGGLRYDLGGGAGDVGPGPGRDAGSAARCGSQPAF